MRRQLTAAVAFVAFLGVVGLGTAAAEEGMAAHYSDAFQGKPTANKETFDQAGMTAAHKTLPFGTRVKVTNLTNNKSVVVTINDRMARRNRNLIDLTRQAAKELDFEKQGRVRVSVEPVQ
jgi:rare lipoprotein A